MKNQTIMWLAVIGVGGYVLYKSEIFSGLRGVGEGLGEAGRGLGAGLSAAGRGLGGGISEAGVGLGAGVGEVGLTVQELMQMYGAGFEAGRGVIERWTAGQEREHEQETEIDIIAFEQEKQRIAEIQAEQERKTAKEKAERKRLLEEEKTQYVEFATTLPERLKRYLGVGALAAWRYSPLGLLQSYIVGQVSIEEGAAPQQSAPITTSGGGAAPTSTISGGAITPTYSVSSGVSRTPKSYVVTEGAAIQELDSGIITLFPDSTIEEVRAPEPELERKWYDPRGWFGW